LKRTSNSQGPNTDNIVNIDSEANNATFGTARTKLTPHKNGAHSNTPKIRRAKNCSRRALIAKRKGFCVSCRTTYSSRFTAMKTAWEDFKKFDSPPKYKKDMLCERCSNGILKGTRNNKPIVKPTTICRGNGLFANRDYKSNELITNYDGNKLTQKELDNLKDKRYVYKKGSVIIDGKYNFSDSLGRYINAPPRGSKTNVVWGFEQLGGKVAIRAKKTRNKLAVKRGNEFVISYGRGYWKNEEKRKNHTN